ncbi:MAG: hypothetical protein IJ672_01775 [Methanobrevibacter sp.]|nr:hypothetical protein [Methanobrevibacter sp.]
MKKLTPTQSILHFLETYGTTPAEKSMEMFNSLVEFLHQEEFSEIIELLKERIDSQYPDFLDYFDTTENILALIDLKTENPDKYYTVIQYTNIILNLLCTMTDTDQVIVLNPEDLYKSYFLVVKLKN